METKEIFCSTFYHLDKRNGDEWTRVTSRSAFSETGSTEEAEAKLQELKELRDPAHEYRIRAEVTRMTETSMVFEDLV